MGFRRLEPISKLPIDYCIGHSISVRLAELGFIISEESRYSDLIVLFEQHNLTFEQQLDIASRTIWSTLGDFVRISIAQREKRNRLIV